ncbi:MAG: hypothetical protein N2166_01510 [candidate division WOR-3 bacterium]|nr:hypothetical protein [candidate division WOR-3 bacterium]
MKLIFALFLFIKLSLSDTLPPLPLKELTNIELRYSMFKSPIILRDSFQIQAYFTPTIAYRKLNLKFNKILTKTALLALDIYNEKNIDFSDFHYTEAELGLGKNTKNAWHNFTLKTKINSRSPIDHDYKALFGNYQLYWFFNNSLLELNNRTDALAYKRAHKHYFLFNTLQLTNYLPCALGNIIITGEFYFRNYNFDWSKNYWDVAFSWADLILIGEYFYLNPKVSYYVPTAEPYSAWFTNKNFGPGIEAGWAQKNLRCIINIKTQIYSHPPYDSVLNILYPYELAASRLKPLVKEIYLKTLVSYKNVTFVGQYEKYRTYWTYNCLPNSVVLTLDDTTYHTVTLGCEVNFTHGFVNKTNFSCAPKTFYLFADFKVSDTLVFSSHPLRIVNYFEFSAARKWINLILPKYFLWSTQINFSYKKFVFTGKVENVLDKKIFIFPNYQNLKARKYWIGIKLFI